MTTKTPRATTRSTASGAAERVDPVDPVDDQVDDQAVDELVDEPAAPAETKAERTARLRAELAELERNDAGVVAPDPTHVLVLANGDTVETANPGTTAHAVEEGGRAYPVISRFELPREEV